tara:strand:- start:371 stop:592 length:222 start_codon:yes stop_codon:yes gene_type:complete
MPYISKRIDYLHSINAHEIINKITTKEKLNQSKVLAILFEDALRDRDELNHRNSNNCIKRTFIAKKIILINYP